MSIYAVCLDQPGASVLLTGNEAIARGAIEAGVSVASCYPGSPTSEVLPALAKWGDKFNIYTEYSTNELVAIEVAGAASMAGLRSLNICKPDGFNLALDFATSVSLAGTRGGMVIMVGDDPNAHSSSKEEDSRFLARTANLPLMEPTTPQEAKDLIKVAFDLSESLEIPVVLRLTTRVCHASGDVILGELRQDAKKALLTRNDTFYTHISRITESKDKLKAARELAENSRFNQYTGPENPERLVIASGPSFLYSVEALRMLGLEDSVGILKICTTWPLPANYILKYLAYARQVVFAEEIDSFLEDGVLTLVASHLDKLGKIRFYGKNSGDVAGPKGPFIGELTTDIMIQCLSNIFGIHYSRPIFPNLQEALDLIDNQLPSRELALCAGCPHRSSFWAIKKAVEMDGRESIVLGDIGCYTLGIHSTGYNVLQTTHCMGAGVGMASGLGKLDRFGFKQPVIAIVGDSTFFHSVTPAVINAVYNQSSFLLVILDNETTAMTGHQPHPGRGINANSEPIGKVEMESLLSGLKIPVTVQDPYDIEETIGEVLRLLKENGPRALVLRRTCALIAVKGKKKDRVYVNQEACIGDDCGCARFCSRVFSCPANVWDEKQGKAKIDEAICNGCGVCASLCPQRAIVVERVV